MQEEELTQEPSLEGMLKGVDLTDPKVAAWLGKMATEAQAEQTAKAQPWTLDDLVAAGLPADKDLLAIAVWYSDLDQMKADLKR